MIYPSIQNHYLTKQVKYKKNEFREFIPHTRWSYEEKIHGCNISFEFTVNSPIKFYSRNQEILGNEFYNCLADLKKYEQILKPVQDYVDKHDHPTIKLYSEYCGPGIMNTIDYGPERRFIFFDMTIGGSFVFREVLDLFFITLELTDYLSIPIGHTNTLEEAMEIDTEINSQYSDKEDNMIEGIVIKPYNQPMLDKFGRPFYLKKKNTKHLEKSQKKRAIKTEFSDKVNDLHNWFISYITEERMYNIFSKEGQFDDLTEMGKYIQLIRNDAIKDFNEENEYDYTEFTQNENRFIFNCSRETVTMLKGEL